ncbi:MAG: DUF1513 domain-containing protein [Bdellovibrionaceae bacterium]|nr:DUF1513 domain-containing protein [Pseudobdellovibrionaceae bacterium]
MSLSRRQFLIGAGSLGTLAAAGAFAAWRGSRPAPRAYLVQGVGHPELSNQTDYKMRVAPHLPGKILIVDMQTLQPWEQNIPVSVHKFTQSPAQPEILFGASKWSDGAVIYDLEKRELVRVLRAPAKTENFFGHGIFSEDGSAFYASGHNFEKKQGLILIYSTRDWTLLDSVDSGGLFPHEITRLPNGQIMIANSVDPENLKSASLTFFDEREFKMQRRILLPFAQHFCVRPDGLVTAGSWNPLTLRNGVYTVDLKSENGDVKEVLSSGQYEGEPLNFLNLSGDRTLISVAQSGFLGVHDFAKQTLQPYRFPGHVKSVSQYQGALYVTSSRGFLQIPILEDGLGKAVQIGHDVDWGPHSDIMYL